MKSRPAVIVLLFIFSGLLFAVPAAKQANATSLSTWIPTGANLPALAPNDQPSCYQYSGYLYCAFESSTTVDTWSTTISSSGQLGASWTAETSFSVSIHNGIQCFGYLAFMYCVDDQSTSGHSATFSASLTSGTIGSWSSTTAYPSESSAYASPSAMFIADGGYVFAIGGNNTNAAGTFCTYVCSANTLYGNHYGYIQTQVASLTSGSIGSWAALTGTSQFSSIFYNPNGGLFQGDAPAQCALVGSDIYCGGSIGMTSNSNPQSTAPFGEFTTVSGGSLGAWATIVNTAGPGNGGVGCVGFQSDYTCIMAGQVTQGHGDTITLTSKTGDTIVYSGGGLGSWSNSSTLSPYGSGHLDYRTASSGLPSSCVTDGSSYITCINLSGYTGNYFVTTGAIIVNPCDSTFSTSANYQVLCLTFPNSSALSVVTQSSTYQSSASTASCTLTATAGDLLVVAIATSFNIVSYNAPTDSATNYYVFTTGMNSTLFNYFGGLAGANLIVGSALSGFSGADTIHAAEGTGAYTTFCYDIHGANYGSQTGAFSKGTGSAVATSIDTLAGQLTVAIMGQSSSGTFTEGSGFYLNSGGTIHDTVGGDYWASETNAPGYVPPPTTVFVTVETSPVDLKNALTVDGTLYPDNPIVVSLANGSIISLKAVSTALKMPGFLSYSFVSWSQGGLQDQSYTVTGNATLIADYTNGASSACAAYSGSGFNALEQQLNHGCEWSVVFYSWFGLFGPWILAFIDFLPALAIYLRTENPGAAIGVYVLIDVVLVYGMTAASMPASINTVAPGLLGAVIAGGIFQLLRSGKGG